MTLKNLNKAPFPWFGGKSQAASAVWALLGDVDHYVEPFAGSLAVLLGRPHPANRPYRSETVNDLDGMVVNFWRAVAADPDAVARAASWPVAEADKQARQIALLRWRDDGGAERLAGDAAYYSAVMAGWWAWAVSVQIGAFSGDGPWTADLQTGRIIKQGMAGRVPGVRHCRPHLSSSTGVNQPGTREPGVSRNRPHLTNNGQGVNHPGTREPGVKRDRPHVSDNGQGVNHPGTREPGVLDPITEDHGRFALDDWGAAYHDVAMPELIRWFRHLAARLRHARVLNGDWKRAVTSGALRTLPVRSGGVAGVFLDPPYADTAERAGGLYAEDSFDVAHQVRDWCLANGENPDYRIVLAGFAGEHGTDLTDAGWTEVEWFADGYLRGGMGDQQSRERLWASPGCLPLNAEPEPQLALFSAEPTEIDGFGLAQ